MNNETPSRSKALSSAERDRLWIEHRNGDCPQCSQALGVLGLCGEGRVLFAASTFSTPFSPEDYAHLKRKKA